MSKKLQEEIDRLKAEVTKAEKERDSAKSTSDYYSRQLADTQREVNAAHALLDALPNPPARKTEDDYHTPYPITTRLTVWIARRVMPS